jgi:disulfide bond formation protein DsbB
MQPVDLVNLILSSLTLIAQLLIGLLLVCLIVSFKLKRKVLKFFGRHALLFAFSIALISMLGSLFFSEIAGYAPCKLCWYQRILMYPQVLILGQAFLKKDKNIADYSILLSALGAGIALYHYLLQRGAVNELMPCTTIGYSVSCTEKFIMTYGYITIPFMALSAFILILLLMILLKKSLKQKNSN